MTDPHKLPAQPGPRRRILAASLPAGWRERRRVWLALLALGLLVLGLGVAAAWPSGRAGLAAVVAQLLLFGVGWTTFLHGLLRQNSVVAAVTVPGHVRTLREVLLAAWLLLLALVWVSAWWLGSNPAVALARAAVVLLALAVAMRWPLSWALFWAFPWLALPPLGGWVRQLQELAGPWGDLVPLPWLLLGGLLLVRLIGQGGPAHRRSDGQRRAMQRSLSGERPPAGADRPGWQAALGAVSRAMAWPYHAALRRAAGRPVLARLMLALGPAVHGGVHAFWGGILLTAGLGVLVWLWWYRQPDAAALIPAQVWGPAIGAMSLALNPVLGLLSAVGKTRREQALLVLLPGVPQAAALNRGLAIRMLLHFGMAWCAGAVALALLSRLAPAAAPALAVAAAGLLPLGAFLCTDLSRLPPGANPHVLGATVCFFGVPALALALHLKVGVAAAPVVLMSLGLAAALVAWRLRALGHAPRAWPGGRRSALRS